MIFDGKNGYLSGDLSQPDGTVLAMTKGPIKGRNFYSSHNPTYSIVITAGATGTVALQGTNDIALKDGNDPGVSIEKDILPTEGATWTDIQAATAVSASGSVAAEYEFLRLIIVASGTGIVQTAWVRWS
jgi:hypothetical protein